MATKKTTKTAPKKTTQKRDPGPMPGDYVIVRTNSAGVHAGVLESRNGRERVLSQVRQIWNWSGALTVKELATTGPTGGKISVAAPVSLLDEAIETLRATPEARAAIERLGAK
jgi:hypothetical protein